MNRTKYLMKNTGILFISSFSSRMLIFFLLPLYTSVLTTAEYGLSDLITTAVIILYSFLTLYVGNGIIRFTMNNVCDQNEMLSVGIYFTLFSSIIVATGSGLVFATNIFPSMNSYYGYLILIYIFYCLGSILNAFSKGREKIFLIGIAGFVSTVVRIASNILLLLVFQLGIHGYLISAVVSHLSSCIIFIAGGLLKGTSLKKPTVNTIIKLIRYSAPIAATELGWLICTSSDIYLVSLLLDNSATGIVSAAHRLPTILTAFTSVFIQAWTLSAIKESENDDKSTYYSKMFNYYNAFAITMGAVLILSSKIIGSFLFRGEFHDAWIYSTIYLLALVINTMSSFSGSIISAGTDTKPLFTSTFTGAALNLLLNVILIKFMGIFGAGIATVVSYIVISSMRMKTVRKSFKLQIDNVRMLFSLVILFILTLTMIFSDQNIWYIISLLLSLLIIYINRKILANIMKMSASLLKSFM